MCHSLYNESLKNYYYINKKPNSMAKKKFLNLDNMNILWDSIDRNFLRREDIPYTEFDEFNDLPIERKDIITAILELYKLVEGGTTPVMPGVTCNPTTITADYKPYTNSNIKVTFENCNSAKASADKSWVTISPTSNTISSNPETLTYTISLPKNDTGSSRSATVTFTGSDKKGNSKSATISITQTSTPSAYAEMDTRFPSGSIEYTDFSSNYNITYYFCDKNNITLESSNPSWLTVSNFTFVSEDTSKESLKYQFKLGVSTNDTGKDRTASIIAKNGSKTVGTFNVTQKSAGSATVSFSKNPISFNWNSNESGEVIATFKNASSTTPIITYDWKGKSPWGNLEVISSSKKSEGVYEYTYMFNPSNTNNSSTDRTVDVYFEFVDLLGNSATGGPLTYTQTKAPTGTLQVSYNGQKNPQSIDVSSDAKDLLFNITYANTEYYYINLEDTGYGIDWVKLANNNTTDSSTNSTYTVSVLENSGTKSREAILSFYCNGYDNVNTADTNPIKIKIIQTGGTGLTVTPSSWEVSHEGGDSGYIFVVKLNDWFIAGDKFTIEENATWLTTSGWDNKIQLHVSPSTSTSSRTTTVNIILKEDPNVKTSIKVTQSGKPAESQKMYIGYVPDPEYKINSYSDITSDMILNGVTKGEIVKSDASAVSKAGFGDVPAESFLLIALPQNSGLSAVKWVEALQVESPFTVDPLVNGEVTVNIDGETYLLYGELTPYKLFKDTKEIHYRIK